MRLKEFIDNSADQETPKGRIIRAIDLAKDQMDMEMCVSLIAGASSEMDNDDLMFIKGYFDKKWSSMQSQHRKIQ